MRGCVPLSASLLAVVCASLLHAESALAQSASAVNYEAQSSWLCRPDKKDGCSWNMDASLVNADGSHTPEPWRAAADAGIDCFYVYPTVSNDRQPNSDLNPQANEEWLVVRQQFARFGSQCRLYAPLYRQTTLTALRAQVAAGDHRLAYGDVKAAWDTYLKMSGPNRGVVLIGHSQGADLLKRLIQEEIDGKPAQRRLVSAILPGTRIAVPSGKQVGGDFKSIPACSAASQTGCVISYSSFRSTMPPTTGGWYGRNTARGMTAICTNPAALAGGSGMLQPYFPAEPSETLFAGAAPRQKSWLKSAAAIPTPFVTLPGMLSSRCVQNETDSFLEVTTRTTPDSKRRDDIGGDLYANGQVLRQWGLHLVDIHLALGNLVDIVRQQGKAFQAK